jgi:hypothetical protein
MIKKTIICFLVFFISWECILQIWHPNFNSAQTDWQKNIIQGEEIITSDKVKTKAKHFVILGSSLAKRLDMDCFSDAANFSLGGLSVFDGLNLLNKLDCSPDTILVEINVITRPENPNYTEQVLYGLKPFLVQNLNSLKSKYQPLGLFSKYATTIISHTSFSLMKKNNVKCVIDLDSKKTNALKVNVIQPINFNEGAQHLAIIQQYSGVDSPSVYNAFENLKDKLKKYSSKGSTIILFEMPVYHKARNLVFPTVNRTIAREIMKDYPFVVTDTSKYFTTDGVHLGKEEATKYTRFLAEFLKFK